MNVWSLLVSQAFGLPVLPSQPGSAAHPQLKQTEPFESATRWSFQLELPGIEPWAFCMQNRCSAKVSCLFLIKDPRGFFFIGSLSIDCKEQSNSAPHSCIMPKSPWSFSREIEALGMISVWVGEWDSVMQTHSQALCRIPHQMHGGWQRSQQVQTQSSISTNCFFSWKSGSLPDHFVLGLTIFKVKYSDFVFLWMVDDSFLVFRTRNWQLRLDLAWWDAVDCLYSARAIFRLRKE